MSDVWYTRRMSPELTQEMRAALQAANGQDLQVIDPKTKHVYVLMDCKKHSQAMDALQAQEDWESVQRGLKQANQGEGMSVQESEASLQAALHFPPKG